MEERFRNNSQKRQTAIILHQFTLHGLNYNCMKTVSEYFRLILFRWELLPYSLLGLLTHVSITFSNCTLYSYDVARTNLWSRRAAALMTRDTAYYACIQVDTGKQLRMQNLTQLCVNFGVLAFSVPALHSS